MHGADLLILVGAIQLFRLQDVWRRAGGMLWGQEAGDLEVLFTLPTTHATDQAEGLALLPWEGHDDRVLIVYDSPDPSRVIDSTSLFIDVFRLP